MGFLIFVGEVIWALAGFLDLLQKNPLADFLMGEFLNARDSSLYVRTCSIEPFHTDSVVGPHRASSMWRCEAVRLQYTSSS